MAGLFLNFRQKLIFVSSGPIIHLPFKIEGVNLMDFMGWLAWLIVGAIAGWLASMVMPPANENAGSLLLDILVGILGSMIGGILFSIIGAPGVTGFNVWSIFVAFIGGVVLLGLFRLFSGSSSSSSPVRVRLQSERKKQNSDWVTREEYDRLLQRVEKLEDQLPSH
jgi:uncharacterized membrane protein YeaQ/YmgE (transglycosylase-associated protein family)